MLPHPLHHGWCWSPMSPLMMAHFFLFLTASASSDLENFLWRLEFKFFKSGVQGSRDKQTVALWWYFCSILFRPSCLWCHVRCYFLSLFCSVLFTLFFVRCVYFIVSHLSLVSSCSSWLMFLSWFWEVCQVLSCLVFTSGCSLYLPSSSCFRLLLPPFVWFPPASCCLMSLTCGPPPSCINSPRLPLSGFRSLS